LVLGALPRIKSSQRIRDALLMGVGLAILANSRPYEGFVFSLPVAFLLFVWLFGKRRPSISISLRRVLLPLTLTLALTAAGLGYYFWRVTGSPFRMPYQVERVTYGVAPYMLWQKMLPEPVYHNVVMRNMYAGEEVAGYKAYGSFLGLILKLYIGWGFFLAPALTLPLLLLIFTLPKDFGIRDIGHSTLQLIFIFVIAAVAWVIETFYNPHYSAPATGLILLFVLVAMRRLRNWGSSGLLLARAIPVVCVASFAVRALAQPLHVPMSEFYEFSWYQKAPPSFGRSAVEKQLLQIPGNQLVVVHYAPDHEPFAEWVYNQADIDRAKIVWARELEPTDNLRLLDYYKGRKVWLLEADDNPPRLTKYPDSTPGPSVEAAAERTK
jgi:hypothetical protein